MRSDSAAGRAGRLLHGVVAPGGPGPPVPRNREPARLPVSGQARRSPGGGPGAQRARRVARLLRGDVSDTRGRRAHRVRPDRRDDPPGRVRSPCLAPPDPEPRRPRAGRASLRAPPRRAHPRRVPAVRWARRRPGDRRGARLGDRVAAPPGAARPHGARRFRATCSTTTPGRCTPSPSGWPRSFETVLDAVLGSEAEVFLWGANYDRSVTWPRFFRDEIAPALRTVGDRGAGRRSSVRGPWRERCGRSLRRGPRAARSASCARASP